MITLHGFPYSNYHNIVKHVLMYKGIDFNEHIVYPKTPELLAVNPTGKVPALTTEDGSSLSESTVLVDYLEEAYPEPALYPADPLDRARVRRLIKFIELYLELPARRLLPALFAQQSVDDATRDDVRAALDRGVAGITELAAFAPYVTGDTLTAADIFLRYALAIPSLVGPSHLDWDVREAIPGLAEWESLMADSDIARKIDADQAANAEEFMAFVSSQLAER